MDTRYKSLLSGGSGSSGPASGEWKIVNPARLDARPGVVEYRYSDLEAAIEGAIRQEREGSPLSGPAASAAVIESALRVLSDHEAVLIRRIQEETGRVEGDLALEFQQTRAMLEGLRSSPDLEAAREARGVAAVVLSAVWPVFYPVQFALFNLLIGNPVILKPSEKTTASVLELFSALRLAHPAWERVQVLAGDRELGRRLVCHEAVSVVVFQGSFETGMRVRQDTLSQPAKEVLLFLGAKNPVILLDSLENTGTIEEQILRDAFTGAGQHCLAASQVWVPARRLEAFVDSFHEKCKAFTIGGPGEGAFMGPILDAAVTDRYFKFIGISEREGARIVMRGKNHPSKKEGHFVTPTLAVFESVSEDRMRRSVSLQTEILAPHLSILSYENEDSLARVLSRSSYGHSAAIFGPADDAKILAERLAFGRIVINRGLFEISPQVRAQVFKRSGNHARLGPGILDQLGRTRWIG